MKKVLLSAVLLSFLAPGAAQASDKFLGIWWWPSHWVDQDFKPFYQDGQMPQSAQWKEDLAKWSPQDWVAANGGDGNQLIQKFYDTRIIKDQYVDGGVPYLEVGTNFYHLGGMDKQRVMQTVDAVYHVSDKDPGMFYLMDGITEKKIGYYTKSAGLVLE